MKVIYLNTNKPLNKGKKAKFLKPAIIDNDSTVQKAISPNDKNFYVVNLCNRIYITFEDLETCFSYLKHEIYPSPQDFKEFRTKKALIDYITRN